MFVDEKQMVQNGLFIISLYNGFRSITRLRSQEAPLPGHKVREVWKAGEV
jgi:hypothetical protein